MTALLKTLFITGAGYAVTLIYTYVIINQAAPETISQVNVYESYLTIISALISLGVVQDASRKIASTEGPWRPHYYETQGFRITLSLIVSMLSLVLYYLTKRELYLLGLSSIAIALSGDFALYAINKPIKGSIVAFARSIVFSTLMLGIIFYTSTEISALQITTAWTISFITCGLLTSRYLETRYFVMPSIPSLPVMKTIGFIAILIFIYNNIRPSFILLINKNITVEEHVYYFEIYKIYFILFSLKRVIVQVYYKKIITEKSNARYDAVILGVLMVAIGGLWASKYLIDYLQIEINALSYQILIDLTIITVLSSSFTTAFTKLFAVNRDRLIAVPIFLAAAFILVTTSILKINQAHISSYIYTLGLAELIVGLSSIYLLRMVNKTSK
ncbi:hypothetical protein [Pseudomonas sp. Y24-6]|uniref:hypothetical protein n=1 Tax=Pseudomonas sp. Y24-6 TaxID=2750013 RepID=UPI001CE0E1FD|nr:hypothetical protein [Pseudomonas sp. Y24-6]MCA4962039.1 hypothetical protein [Pseudomonas sp. Y24-6]